MVNNHVDKYDNHANPLLKPQPIKVRGVVNDLAIALHVVLAGTLVTALVLPDDALLLLLIGGFALALYSSWANVRASASVSAHGMIPASHVGHGLPSPGV